MPIQVIAGVNSPRGLDVDAAGRLYISDWWNQRIVRTDPATGNTVAWGQRGTREQLGALNFAWDVAIQPGTGRVFVANRESHEIEVFASDGTPIAGWGSRGTANDPTGDFQFPNGVDFAPDGSLWVLDSENHRVQRFAIAADGTGTLISVHGSAGSGPDGLVTPMGLDVAPDGSVWIADQGTNTLHRLNPATDTWTEVGNPGLNRFSPRGVAVDASGAIWATDAAENRLVQLQPDGTLIFAVRGFDMGAGPFNEPFAIAFGAGGSVYLSDLWHNRVVALDDFSGAF